MRQDPSTYGLTFCASGGHDAYPLPPLPRGFSWGWLELHHPVAAIELVDLVAQIPEEGT